MIQKKCPKCSYPVQQTSYGYQCVNCKSMFFPFAPNFDQEELSAIQRFSRETPRLTSVN